MEASKEDVAGNSSSSNVKPRTGAPIDQIKFEVIRNAMQAAVEENSAALARSAYSTNIKTRMDFSCAFFDRKMRIIVQAFNQASHLGLLVFSVPATLKAYGTENLGPGDGVLINDAHQGLSHLNDIGLFSPIHYKGNLWGFAANLAHHVDVGGNSPGSLGVSTEIYQEGIIIPGVKILKNGEIDVELAKLISSNVRGDKEFAGDLRAQVAANKLAERRVTGLLDRFGVENVDNVIEQLFDYTERRYKLAVEHLPEGEYRGESDIDDDGITDIPIKVKASVTIKGGRITIDLSGSDKQVKGPMNSTYPQTFSSCAYPVKALLPADIPINDGFYRGLQVNAPKGTVVNCEFPAAVVGGWEVGIKVTEAVFRAFALASPERIPAEGKKCMFQLAFGGFDRLKNRRYVFYESVAGGYGARPTSDGPDAVQTHFQNTENSPVEELELGYPIVIVKYELIPDSGGAGRFRGGLGVRRQHRFRDHLARVSIFADTVVFPPRGSLGGGDGAPARFVLNPGTGEDVILRSKITFEAKPTDIVSSESPGGGGYGRPFERDPRLVLEDVRNGKVSAENARALYGVVVDKGDWSVDREATAGLRTTTTTK